MTVHRNVQHDGFFFNTYTFSFNNYSFTLKPSPPIAPSLAPSPILLLQRAPFEEEMCEEGLVVVLFAGLIKEFSDVFPEDLLSGLPPLRDIQHRMVFGTRCFTSS